MERVDEYDDPRIAATYDLFNAFAADTQFYLDLADERPSSEIVDLGCGTGLLACELAKHGHRVTGVDPAHAMLEVARARPGGDRVTWVEGDARSLQPTSFDLLVMTGHVAQVFVSDAQWRAVLGAAHQTLVPGGRLAFESRDPTARAWESWDPDQSYGRAEHPELGTVDGWHEVTRVEHGVVRFDSVTRFATGEELVSTSELRFRTQEDLTASVIGAGFEVEHVFGDWDRRPAYGRPELIVVASRAE